MKRAILRGLLMYVTLLLIVSIATSSSYASEIYFSPSLPSTVCTSPTVQKVDVTIKGAIEPQLNLAGWAQCISGQIYLEYRVKLMEHDIYFDDVIDGSETVIGKTCNCGSDWIEDFTYEQTFSNVDFSDEFGGTEGDTIEVFGYIESVSSKLDDVSYQTSQYNIDEVSCYTRIISLSGHMSFGNVTVDQTLSRSLTISNTGSSTLTVSLISCPSGFTVGSGDWNGTISAGGSESVMVTFSPTAAQNYGGTITVYSDKTGGTNTISCSGTGVEIGRASCRERV